MKPILLLATLLLAACAADPGDPPASESVPAADTTLQSVPVAGAIPEAQRRADEAEAAMAEHARQAQEQAEQAQGGASEP